MKVTKCALCAELTSFPEDTQQYWLQVGLVLNQFDGMIAGYNHYASKQKVILS
jgi:hypothetical protein